MTIVINNYDKPDVSLIKGLLCIKVHKFRVSMKLLKVMCIKLNKLIYGHGSSLEGENGYARERCGR